MHPATVEDPADTGTDAPDTPGPLPALVRAAGPLVVVVALGLVLAGVANVRAAGTRTTVQHLLDRTQVYATALPAHLAAGDAAAAARDLDGIVAGAHRARASAGGPTWWVAARLGAGGPTRDLRDRTARLQLLAGAAVGLRTALAPLAEPAGGAKEAPVVQELDGLDELARALNGYATAATRAQDPSAPDLDRAATAAGLLPDLAGAQAARTWTTCRTATGPCTSVTMQGGRAGATGYRDDVQVTGVDRATLFGGAQTPVWNTAAMFALLVHLGPGSGVSVHSPVLTEQQAIRRLSRPDE